MRPVGWWLEEAPPDSAAPPLEGEVDADVAIVGGGYTGLWTALELKRRDPALRVVLLEAGFCGHGPSGRNGGFLESYWCALATLRDRLGDGAVAVARASEGVFDAVRGLGDDVWLREGGMLTVSTSTRQDAQIDEAVAAARSVGAGEEAVPLGPADVRTRCDSPEFRRAVYYRKCATVQPARLARALRRRALDAGVVVHERTRATSIRDGAVTAERGRVRAPEVVVVTNAWAAGWGPLARVLTPFGSSVVLTEPVPELVRELGWTGGEAIRDARMFLHYFRTTPDGRVLMGSASGSIGFSGRIGTRFDADEASLARAEAGLRRLLPQLAEVRVERGWGGPIDVSSDHVPVFGTVPGSRIHFGAGYTGNGVGPSWLGGKILASLAFGGDDEWTQLPLVHRRAPKLPPEPINFVGGSLVRAAMMAREDALEQGRRPSRVAGAVAELPRRFGLRVGTR